MLIPVRELERGRSLLDTVGLWIREHLSVAVQDEALASALRSGSLALLLDGLDEVDRADRSVFSEHLSAAFAAGAIARITASSRVVGAESALPQGMRSVRVPPLTRDDARRLLTEIAGAHLDAAAADQLYALSAGNPLMLQMLSDAYGRRGQVATTRSSVLRDAVDGALVVVQDL